MDLSPPKALVDADSRHLVMTGVEARRVPEHASYWGGGVPDHGSQSANDGG